MRSDLRIDWATWEAAKYAVEHWHYSKVMPKSKIAKIGAWEDDRFVGVVIFGTGSGGATNGTQYGLLRMFAICELLRVASTEHATPVTRIVSLSMRWIVKAFPRTQMFVSYADPQQNHHGGIYQAGNWIYVGITKPCTVYVDTRGIYGKRGRIYHPRVCSPSGMKTHFNKSRPCPRYDDLTPMRVPGKHKYLYPIAPALRSQIVELAQPYPKRAGTIVSDGPANHAGQGGANPTPALQKCRVANG